MVVRASNTFILEGTEINDQFVVYVDDDGVQQIKGAGVDMGSIQNVQNIQINAIDGDDTIYIYGVNAETRLTVNAGRGNDTIQIGGPALLFNPDSQSIDLDTTAPTALVPTVVYEEVEEFVPGFTRVERIANPDGTETVRQIAVPGYTRIKEDRDRGHGACFQHHPERAQARAARHRPHRGAI